MKCLHVHSSRKNNFQWKQQSSVSYVEAGWKTAAAFHKANKTVHTHKQMFEYSSSHTNESQSYLV